MEALDNDADSADARYEALNAKLDRIQWAIVGLALTIAGSVVIYLFTQGLQQ